MGFLGPNGAGKTTAIRVILGILPPSSGSVQFFWDGVPGARAKQRVGYLPEERGLYDDARVLDSLVYLAALKGVSPAQARERALRWLETMDLGAYAHHKLEKLSKGMQQKVQFIATVLHQPELVVLDEPFSGLDPINQDLFKNLILELRNQGSTVLPLGPSDERGAGASATESFSLTKASRCFTARLRKSGTSTENIVKSGMPRKRSAGIPALPGA